MAITFTPYGGIDGLVLVEGKDFRDARGTFMESFRADVWAQAGLPPLLQDNLSRSNRGVIRGLHYQKDPQAVGKLVRCVSGRIFDVAVDIRKSSPSFGKWASIELSGEGNRAFWIPPGFAHGFCALTDDAIVAYKVTGYWAPNVDGGLRWDDPAVGVAWPLPKSEIRLSPKDAVLPPLSAI
ncbi:MAG: dTDP-4-dehydrorhamnose 3,5-epimerase [Elusimicrobia bacterium RBG_16_66_12]|nr:MAG: dTDP-4-dehydrorhamnose 3,5-epimerase [Elusimicrobia bacterium RBG_16_66_12]